MDDPYLAHPPDGLPPDEFPPDDKPKKRRRRGKKPRTSIHHPVEPYLKGLLIAIGLGLVALAGWYLLSPSPFEGQLEPYLALPGRPPDPLTPLPAVGKVLVLDVANRTIHPLHWEIPSHVRANSPQEVVTVVHLRVGAEATGAVYRSDNGGRVAQATRAYWRLILIDLATGVKIREQVFQGESPLPVVMVQHRPSDPDRSISGFEPWAAGRAYLSGLLPKK